MTRAALTALVLAACSRPPAPMPPIAAASLVTPYCVPLVVQVDGVDVDGRACAAELWACERAKYAAEQLGSLAGVISVGTCASETTLEEESWPSNSP